MTSKTPHKYSFMVDAELMPRIAPPAAPNWEERFQKRQEELQDTAVNFVWTMCAVVGLVFMALSVLGAIYSLVVLSWMQHVGDKLP